MTLAELYVSLAVHLPIASVCHGCPGTETLPQWAFVRLATWVDAAGAYYGSYWGRRHIRFKDYPSFRPAPTFAEAIDTQCPIAIEAR